MSIIFFLSQHFIDESGTIEFEEFLYAVSITSKSSLDQKVLSNLIGLS